MVKVTGESAFPTHGALGMTLRDYFAASICSKDIAVVNVPKDQEELTGRKRPNDYPYGLDSIKFNMEIEAALRGMYADCMLAERAK